MESIDSPAERSTVRAALPRGRHGLPRELVRENQRERLVAATIEVVAEQGYGKTTIARITKAAKLSRKTFYECYDNKEDAFIAAYDASSAYLRETMLAAAAPQREWPERVRAGLSGLLVTLAEHSDLATFFIVAPSSAGDEIAERHHVTMRGLISSLIAGPPKPPRQIESAETHEEAMAGGVLKLIGRRLNAHEAASLPELLPNVVELVLRPFLGNEDAIRLAQARP